MERRLRERAHSEGLLIACDFDGTLAPIVDDPRAARASEEVMQALRVAASLPGTWSAIVSGRAMADLRRRVEPADGIFLVGGHGASISGRELERSAPEVGEVLDLVERFIHRVAPQSWGFYHERKPASIAVHYRHVDRSVVEPIVPLLMYGIAIPAGLRVMRGKYVVEFLGTDEDKGTALLDIKKSLGDPAVVFIGDDVTDEDAFGVLGPSDAGVRVGGPPTRAEFTVSSMEAAHRLICEIVERRKATAWARRRAAATNSNHHAAHEACQ